MSQTIDEERASYLFQRQVLGTLAVLFPALLAGVSLRIGLGVQHSISDHAADPIVGTLFTGTLFMIASFFIAYRGPNGEDRNVARLAGLAALVVALCPNTSQYCYVRTAHFAGAGSLFVLLAYFSAALYNRTEESKNAVCLERVREFFSGLALAFDPTQKPRVRYFSASGVAMLSCLVLIGGAFKLEPHFPSLAELQPVFFLEWLITGIFGLSWLVKGKVLDGASGVADAAGAAFGGGIFLTWMVLCFGYSEDLPLRGEHGGGAVIALAVIFCVLCAAGSMVVLPAMRRLGGAKDVRRPLAAGVFIGVIVALSLTGITARYSSEEWAVGRVIVGCEAAGSASVRSDLSQRWKSVRPSGLFVVEVTPVEDESEIEFELRLSEDGEGVMLRASGPHAQDICVYCPAGAVDATSCRVDAEPADGICRTTTPSCE